MNSKGSTWYTQSCTGMFLDTSLWAVTWGVDCEMALLGHNSPIPVHTWNNSLHATSCVQAFALYLKMMSTAMQRRQEVLPQHLLKSLCPSRVSQLLHGKGPEHPSQPASGSGNSELPWLSANDKIRSPDANAHYGNASVHSVKAHGSTFQALFCFLTPKPSSFWFSKASSLVKHCPPKQLQVLLDGN